MVVICWKKAEYFLRGNKYINFLYNLAYNYYYLYSVKYNISSLHNTVRELVLYTIL